MRTPIRRSARLASATTSAALIALALAQPALASTPPVPPSDFEAGGTAGLLQLDTLLLPGVGGLMGLGVAETETTGTPITALSGSRNADLDLGGSDFLDAVEDLVGENQPDERAGQFLGVPLSDFGGVGVGEGTIYHATAYDRTDPCPPAEGVSYTQSTANVESVVLGPDAMSPGSEDSNVGETVVDGADGGDLDNLIDPLNDAVGSIAAQLDPASDGLDEVVDTIFGNLGLPVPGGALFGLSSSPSSGVASSSEVVFVPGATDGRQGVQVRAYADTVDFSVLGELVHVEVIRPAGLTVTALGVPGSADIDYIAPIVRVAVAGTDVVTLDASEEPQTFEIPGLLSLTVGEMVEQVRAEDGSAVAANASTLRLAVVDPVAAGGVGVLDLVVGPVSASISKVSAGGVVCGHTDPDPDPTPPPPPPPPPPGDEELPVTGGGAILGGLTALAGAFGLRRRG